jgi:hypothetical protein
VGKEIKSLPISMNFWPKWHKKLTLEMCILDVADSVVTFLCVSTQYRFGSLSLQQRLSGPLMSLLMLGGFLWEKIL